MSTERVLTLKYYYFLNCKVTSLKIYTSSNEIIYSCCLPEGGAVGNLVIRQHQVLFFSGVKSREIWNTKYINNINNEFMTRVCLNK